MTPAELRHRADRLNDIRHGVMDLLLDAAAAVEGTPQEGVAWLEQIRIHLDDDHALDARADATVLSSIAALIALADGDTGRPDGWP